MWRGLLHGVQQTWTDSHHTNIVESGMAFTSKCTNLPFCILGKTGEGAIVTPVMAIVHYNDVIMGAIASQITSLTIVYSTVYSDADQRKHRSSASLAFVRGIHRRPVNSPHKWPVARKCFPLMTSSCAIHASLSVFFVEVIFALHMDSNATTSLLYTLISHMVAIWS